jgi:hypothetical protein
MPAPLLCKLSESFPLAAKALPVIVISLLAGWIHNYVKSIRSDLPISLWKLPLIGNLHQLALIDRSRVEVAEKFHEWSEQLGLFFYRCPDRVYILDTSISVCHLHPRCILTDLSTGTDILLLDLAGVRLVILDTYQAAVHVLIKSGNDTLQRFSTPFTH